MMTSHGHMMTSHGHMMGQTTPSPMSAVQVMNDGDHMSTTAVSVRPFVYVFVVFVCVFCFVLCDVM